MTYALTQDGNSIIRDADGASIPVAPGNRDYADYLEWVAAGNNAAPYTPPPLTTNDVNAERDRRMAVFSFGGKDYDFDNESRQNVSGAGTLALAAIINGAEPGDYRWSDPDVDFVWLARDNTATLMDAQTTWAFAQAGAAWKRDLIYAARTIKDMQGGIPSDYATNEDYWP